MINKFWRAWLICLLPFFASISIQEKSPSVSPFPGFSGWVRGGIRGRGSRGEQIRTLERCAAALLPCGEGRGARTLHHLVTAYTG